MFRRCLKCSPWVCLAGIALAAYGERRLILAELELQALEIKALHRLGDRRGDANARLDALVATLGAIVPRVDVLERLAGGPRLQRAERELERLGPVREPGTLRLTDTERERAVTDADDLREARDAA